MINNRQNGRRRGRGGGNGGSGGGGNGPRQGGGQGRDNGNRIDNRARGNAAQLLEKYKALAADAQRLGDRVNTEYYLQFADHYFRVLSEQRSRFEDQQPQQQRRQQADSFDDDGEDYGDEGEMVRGDEQSMGREEQPRNDQRGDQSRGDYRRDEQRGEQRRDEQPREQGRGEQARDDQPRVAQREARGDRQSRRDGREARGPIDGNRAEGNREPRGGNGHETRDATPEVEAAQAAPAAVTDDRAEAAPVARRRGRPPKVRDEAPVEAFDADRLPPALSISTAPAADASNGEDGEPKPRRRRVRAATAEVQAG